MVSAVALSCAASPQSRLAVACKSRNAVIAASHSSSIPVIPVSSVWLTSVRYCEVLGYFLTLCAAGHRCRSSRAVNCPPCSSSPPFLKRTALRQVDMQQLCSSCAAVIEWDCGKSEIQFILSRRSLYAVANNHRVAVTASGRWAWFWQHFESLCGNQASSMPLGLRLCDRSGRHGNVRLAREDSTVAKSRDAERLRGLEVDHQLELSRLLERQIGRLLSLHLNYCETVLPIRGGLLKLKDFPAHARRCLNSFRRRC